MNRMEIAEALAKDRTVEQMVAAIAHRPLDADLRDLVQMVYLIVMEYDDGKIRDLWEHGEIRFFLARVIMNQLRSRNSPYYATVLRFRQRSEALTMNLQDNG